MHRGDKTSLPQDGEYRKAQKSTPVYTVHIRIREKNPMQKNKLLSRLDNLRDKTIKKMVHDLEQAILNGDTSLAIHAQLELHVTVRDFERMEEAVIEYF